MQVIAHEATNDRFDRYIRTAGYNGVINQRQFRALGLHWPTEYRRPDRTYDGDLAIDLGGEPAELHHARGETDDHTWVWWPERRVVCTGDLIIWCSPNAGNPQKVQRYALEWAAALRTMAALEPELLLPGHGLPVAGAAEVPHGAARHRDAAGVLVDQTLALMNDGARLDDVLHTVKPAGAPRGQAVPAADLRRARVHRAQHVAALRRLVRRQPRPPPPAARRVPGRRGAASPAARARSGPGPWRRPTPATSASPANSPSGRPRPIRPTRPPRAPGPR